MSEYECLKQKEIAELTTTQSFIIKLMDDLRKNDIAHIYQAIDAIREKMSNRRPTYAIMWIITVLSSMCVGLITMLFK